MLREHVAHGLDGAIAVSLTAATLASRTAFGPGACEWVVSELAIALGLPHRGPASSHPAAEARSEGPGTSELRRRAYNTTVPGEPSVEAGGSQRGARPARFALFSAICIALAGAAGAGIYAADRPGGHPHRLGSRHAQEHRRHAHPAGRSPVEVVKAYITAINQHNWPVAWALGGKNLGESYRQLIAGYAHTRDVRIASITAAAGTVTVIARATETNGIVQRYRFSYQVGGGAITAGQSELLSTSG